MNKPANNFSYWPKQVPASGISLTARPASTFPSISTNHSQHYHDELLCYCPRSEGAETGTAFSFLPHIHPNSPVHTLGFLQLPCTHEVSLVLAFAAEEKLCTAFVLRQGINWHLYFRGFIFPL